MSGELRIQVLGELAITLDGRPIAAARVRKAAALLVYLALTGRPQPREGLATLLWGDLPDEAARGNLRQTLATLRASLGDRLRADRALVALAPDQPTWIDATAFERALREREPAAALALYRGDFLAGFAVPDAPEFGEWALVERERLRQAALGAAERLAGDALARGDYDEAGATARRMLALDPWQEGAHRLLMEALALDGRRDAALAHYRACQRTLREELGVEPSPETTALAERIRAGRLGTPPAPAPAALALPAAVASVIGRDAAIGALRALLTPPGGVATGPRLVTLTGPGGVGKTTLALAAGREVAGAFADGVRLVELAALADPRLIAGAVATALRLPEEPGETREEGLLRALAGRHLLLILDNCEHLIEAVADLADRLLRCCPRVTLLATSREPLRCAGELRWPVPPLGVEDAPDREVPPAMRLFAERAAAARPGFAITAQNASAVGAICRQLDGIPLAIELAAARCAFLSIDQLTHLLAARFRVLTDGNRTALPRHRTLRAAIDWSHDLLAPEERALFRRLAVFAGGWTLEAAEAVGGGPWAAEGEQGSGSEARPATRRPPPADPLATLMTLGQLVDKSLVQVEVAAEGECRYHFLETVRQYALEQLATAGEEPMARERHYAWCLALVGRAEPALFRGPGLTWLNADYGNLRAALGWCLATPAMAERGVRLAAALGTYWYLREYFGEGLYWLEGLLGTIQPLSDATRAAGMSAAGMLANYCEDYPRAARYLEACLALPPGPLGTERRCAALGNLSEIAAARGEVARARHFAAEGLRLAASDDVPPAMHIAAILRVGNAAYFAGDLAVARERFLATIAEAEREQLPLARSRPLHFLGLLALAEGNLPEAEAFVKESLAVATSHGVDRFRALALSSLGQLAAARGDRRQALHRHCQGLALIGVHGRRQQIAGCLEGLAGALVMAADAAAHRHAARFLGAANRLRASVGTPVLAPHRAGYEATVGAARLGLGAEDYAAAWAAGEALPLSDLFAEALALDPGPTGTDE